MIGSSVHECPAQTLKRACRVNAPWGPSCSLLTLASNCGVISGGFPSLPEAGPGEGRAAECPPHLPRAGGQQGSQLGPQGWSPLSSHVGLLSPDGSRWSGHWEGGRQPAVGN